MTGLSDTEPLPISLVAQHVFCPRRAWLEAAGETTDTYQMAVGIAEHAPTENPATGRPDRLRISVFIVDVKPARIVRLRTILGKILVASEDSVVICELGTVARAVELRIDFLGLKPKLLGQDTIIV